MRSVITIFFFLFSITCSNAATIKNKKITLSCNYLKVNQTLKLTVDSGANVEMSALSNPGSFGGYEWISNEGIPSRLSKDKTKQIFNLKITSPTNSFIFFHKRPWEVKPASKCIIILKIK